MVSARLPHTWNVNGPMCGGVTKTMRTSVAATVFVLLKMIFFSFSTGVGGRVGGMSPLLLLIPALMQGSLARSLADILLTLIDGLVFFLGLKVPELRQNVPCQTGIVLALYVLAAFLISTQVRKAYQEGGWPAVGRILLLGTYGQHAAAAAAGGQGGPQRGQAAGGQGGRATASRPRTTLDDVTTVLQRLPMEEHASEAELQTMPVHDLKERLTARGIDCSQFVEKRELLEQLAKLAEKGGSSAASCSVCCEDYVSGDVVRVLPCEHRFHIECIDKWLLSATDYTRPPACPLCNAELIKQPATGAAAR